MKSILDVWSNMPTFMQVVLPVIAVLFIAFFRASFKARRIEKDRAFQQAEEELPETWPDGLKDEWQNNHHSERSDLAPSVSEGRPTTDIFGSMDSQSINAMGGRKGVTMREPEGEALTDAEWEEVFAKEEEERRQREAAEAEEKRQGYM